MNLEGNTIQVVVHGATPAGIATAVCASRMGASVTLLAINDHVGGMMAGGLSYTDTTLETPRAAFHDEVFDRIEAYYLKTYGPDSAQYQSCNGGLNFEPHVAESVFLDLLEEANVDIKYEYTPIHVERSNSNLQSVTFESKRDTNDALTLAGDVFVDATYEGDLYAEAGVPYRIGRESREEYDEQYAGRLFSEKGSRLFAGSTGEGDNTVQSYNYRLCLTNDPDNRRPIEKPPGYDRSVYTPIVDQPAEGGRIYRAPIEEIPCHLKSELVLADVDDMHEKGLEFLMLRGPLPNGKRDLNTADLPGLVDEYPEGDWDTRREIAWKHRCHVLGLLYFMQTDPAVPEAVRSLWSEWGLPRDEFEDNDNFPFQLYVREARRLEGIETFSEHHARVAQGTNRAPPQQSGIAVTDYPMDSHDCRPIRRHGTLCEGHFYLHELTVPGQVPFETMVTEGLNNLIVPTALSATHVGYGTIRLEPTWLQIGEAAGVAIGCSEDGNVADVAIETLQRTLLKRECMLAYFEDLDYDHTWDGAIQYFATKGFFPTYKARPTDPLETDVADVWIQTAAALGENDPTATARRCYELEESPPISASDFRNMVEHEFPEQSITEKTLPDPVTRRAACEFLYSIV